MAGHYHSRSLQKEVGYRNFFQVIKTESQCKDFYRNKSQCSKVSNLVALIAYLILELLRRVKAKGKTAFSDFVEKIRIRLFFYLSLDYIILEVRQGARSIKSKQKRLKFEEKGTLF